MYGIFRALPSDPENFQEKLPRTKFAENSLSSRLTQANICIKIRDDEIKVKEGLLSEKNEIIRQLQDSMRSMEEELNQAKGLLEQAKEKVDNNLNAEELGQANPEAVQDLVEGNEEPMLWD